GRGTAVLPGIAAPGFIARFALRRNGPKSPCALAGCGIVRIDEAAISFFAACHANNDFIFESQRSHALAIDTVSRNDFGVPEETAVARIDRDQMRVGRSHEQAAANHRESPVQGSATGPRVFRYRVLETP